MEIVDLNIYPFGNAQVVSRYPPSFICQNGEDECFANIIQSCVIQNNTVDYYMGFVNCMESNGIEMLDYVEECAKKYNIDYNNLKNCFETDKGLYALLYMADMAPKDHKYVPWAVVNNNPLLDDLYNIVQYVCDSFKGNRPKSCDNFKCERPVVIKKSLAEERIHITAYIESHCGSCVKFVTKELFPLYKDEKLMKHIDVTLIPFGKGKILKDNIICQHGEIECYGNTIFGCSIDIYKDFNIYFPFINCLEENYKVLTGNKTIHFCALLYKLDANKILSCANSERGYNILKNYGLKTPPLKSLHLHVPYVLINDQPINTKIRLFTYICNLIPKSNSINCNRNKK